MKCFRDFYRLLEDLKYPFPIKFRFNNKKWSYNSYPRGLEPVIGVSCSKYLYDELEHNFDLLVKDITYQLNLN